MTKTVLYHLFLYISLLVLLTFSKSATATECPEFLDSKYQRSEAIPAFKSTILKSGISILFCGRADRQKKKENIFTHLRVIINETGQETVVLFDGGSIDERYHLVDMNNENFTIVREIAVPSIKNVKKTDWLPFTKIKIVCDDQSCFKTDQECILNLSKKQPREKTIKQIQKKMKNAQKIGCHQNKLSKDQFLSNCIGSDIEAGYLLLNTLTRKQDNLFKDYGNVLVIDGAGAAAYNHYMMILKETQSMSCSSVK